MSTTNDDATKQLIHGCYARFNARQLAEALEMFRLQAVNGSRTSESRVNG